MRIIKPSVEFFGVVPTDYENALKFIEKCGRVCYKSEDKITEGSAEKFVKRLIKSGHLAMVEHSNFVVRAIQEVHVSAQEFECLDVGKFLNKHEDNVYYYVGGNLTAWYQYFLKRLETFHEGLLSDPFGDIYGELFEWHYITNKVAQWGQCPHDEIPHELHRYSAKFICDRGVSHELVRHRPCSFAQESTRYVNYAGKDMEFVEPAGYDEWSTWPKMAFSACCIDSEARYASMIRQGLKPQQARAVLPNALKTEIVATADAREWAHIRRLRTAKDAHPDIQRVMNMMPWEEFL